MGVIASVANIVGDAGSTVEGAGDVTLAAVVAVGAGASTVSINADQATVGFAADRARETVGTPARGATAQVGNVDVGVARGDEERMVESVGLASQEPVETVRCSTAVDTEAASFGSGR